MPSLRSGVLLELLRNIESPADPPPSPVLQVTGIIPALAGSELFPDRGFYLQVSDSSHSTYVSLPPGHDDLILSDSLHIGQLIHVRRLEQSSPVPVLHGLRLLPGRHPLPSVPATRSTKCQIRDSPALSQLSRVSSIDKQNRDWDVSSVSSSRTSIMDPLIKKRQPTIGNVLRVEAWKNGLASPGMRLENRSKINRIGEEGVEWDSSCSLSSTDQKKSRPPTGNMVRVEGLKSGLASPAPARSQLRKVSVNRTEDENSEWDASSVITSTPSSSFDSLPPMVSRRNVMRKIWESSDRLKGGKQETKPVIRTRSATFSQGDFTRSFTDKVELLENQWTEKREGDTRCTELLNNTTKRKLTTQSKPSTKNSFAANPFSIYDDTKWPESNVLWGSLSLNFVKYGKEILSQRDAALYTALDALQETCALERLIRCLSAYSELQAIKQYNPQLVVDKFLNFHHDLSSATSSTEAAKEALDRRTFAASWIKAALESELSTAPAKSTDSTDHPHASRKFQHRQRKCAGDTAVARGSCSLKAKALQSECNRWFLKYIERFLDVVHGDGSYTSNESRIAALLCQLKRVNDWLVTVEGVVVEEDEAEACGRVRRKIYELFLKHVESAAMALDGGVNAGELPAAESPKYYS